MSEPFVGEIRMFAGNFAPRGWAFCDGQLLAVSQNDALFSLFGTIYGGDGRTTFGLPDLRGRIPVHQGQGPGLSNRRLGQKGGAERVTLNSNQLPAHSHPLMASSDAASATSPSGSMLGTPGFNAYASAAPADAMNASAIGNAGGGQGHSNLQPFLCINFIVALVGIYPSRN
ncbi:MAG: tail fiber protein [Anaerolineae bacterium]|jgi:microcystin-dependent protein